MEKFTRINSLNNMYHLTENIFGKCDYNAIFVRHKYKFNIIYI